MDVEMSSERKTVTAPPADLPVGVEGRPSIIGLRLLGTNKELMLSPSLDVTRVGASSDCDIVIANQFISSVHCLIERKGNALVLDDQGSKNGTLYEGRPCSRFQLVDGAVFVLGTTAIIPFTEESRRSRTLLQRLIGYGPEVQQRVDKLLIKTKSESHLLIVGETGTRKAELARVIHGASPRTKRPFIELGAALETKAEQGNLLKQAAHAAVFIHEHLLRRDVGFFLDSLRAGTYDVRLYVATTSDREANIATLGLDFFLTMSVVEIPPLRQRLADLPRLIQSHLESRPEHGGTVPSISAANHSALCRHEWPGNLDELAEAIDRTVALERAGSTRKAAKALAIPKSTLADWMKRIGVSA